MASEKFNILNRFSGAVIFTAKITCSPDALPSIKLGLAVKAAISAGANLAGAYLARANLADANLARAYLADANLAGANLADANLADANLADANLADANLAGAYLAGANLAGAYLARANLADANLAGANLADAKGLVLERINHLASLKFMSGTLSAFKVVNARGEGHIQGGIKYEIGQRVSVDNADTNINETCSTGIHVADLPWCLREWREGYRVLVVEHSPEDIACVPTASDGKYRLHGCTPVRDITDDLRGCGALPALPEVVAPDPKHPPRSPLQAC